MVLSRLRVVRAIPARSIDGRFETSIRGKAELEEVGMPDRVGKARPPPLTIR